MLHDRVGAACGGDTATGPDESITGSYTLRTINGQNLPYTTLSSGVSKAEVLSSSLSLDADGTFREERSVRRTHSGVSITEPEMKFGTYTSTGSGVTFRATSGAEVSGTRGGGSITFVEDAFTFVYGRQSVPLVELRPAGRGAGAELHPSAPAGLYALRRRAPREQALPGSTRIRRCPFETRRSAGSGWREEALS